MWDALVDAGRAFDVLPAGMLALDVARVEAGLLLIDVDFVGSKKAMIADQKYHAVRARSRSARQISTRARSWGDRRLREAARAPRRQIVGLEIDWSDVEAIYERVGLPPVAPAAASRTPVPVRYGERQVGRATTTTWSPTLKRMIAIACLDTPRNCGGHAPAIRDHRRGHSPLRGCDCRPHAVLQPRLARPLRRLRSDVTPRASLRRRVRRHVRVRDDSRAARHRARSAGNCSAVRVDARRSWSADLHALHRAAVWQPAVRSLRRCTGTACLADGVVGARGAVSADVRDGVERGTRGVRAVRVGARVCEHQHRVERAVVRALSRASAAVA